MLYAYTCTHQDWQGSLGPPDFEPPPPESTERAGFANVKLSPPAAARQQTFPNGERADTLTCTISEECCTPEGLETLPLWGMGPKRKGSPNSWGQAQVSSVCLTHLLTWENKAQLQPRNGILQRVIQWDGQTAVGEPRASAPSVLQMHMGHGVRGSGVQKLAPIFLAG